MITAVLHLHEHARQAGGKLGIEWRERDDHVLMTGTATFEYEGAFDPALFEPVR